MLLFNLSAGVRQLYKLITPTAESQVPSPYNQKYAIYDDKFAALTQLLSKIPFYQCIVFLNHRGRFDFYSLFVFYLSIALIFLCRALDLTNYLTKQGYPSTHIAGGIDQRQ